MLENNLHGICRQNIQTWYTWNTLAGMWLPDVSLNMFKLSAKYENSLGN